LSAMSLLLKLEQTLKCGSHAAASRQHGCRTPKMRLDLFARRDKDLLLAFCCTRSAHPTHHAAGVFLGGTNGQSCAGPSGQAVSSKVTLVLLQGNGLSRRIGATWSPWMSAG